MLRKVQLVWIRIGRGCYLDFSHTRVKLSRTCCSECVRSGCTTGQITQLNMHFPVIQLTLLDNIRSKSCFWSQTFQFLRFSEIHFFVMRQGDTKNHQLRKTPRESTGNRLIRMGFNFQLNRIKTREMRAYLKLRGEPIEFPPQFRSTWTQTFKLT